MKITKAFKRKPLAQWIACGLAMASVSGAVYAAAPLAGAEIKNLATVSYEDENGNQYTAQSNEAVITVAPQYRATLAGDRTQSAAPGQTVYFPHTLVNTGNTPDTYTLAATDGTTAGIVYDDQDGNGEPNAGESAITTITLAPGETANLVVGYVIPAGTANGVGPTVTLTATSGNAAGIVTDIGDNADHATDNDGANDTPPNGDVDSDSNSATNMDIVNITTGPVLVLNKKAVFDAANNKVTYTLTVKNTGGADAKLVDIIDAVPRVDHDDDAGTASLSLTGVTIDSVNGLLTSSGDTVPAIGAAVLAQEDETVLGDLDGDGLATNTAVDVIKATDAVLSPNTTVSVVYSANYDPAWRAGQTIKNTFITAYDDDNDINTPKIPTSSNTTTNTIPQTYSVIAKDDGIVNATSPNVNDGHDDNADGDIDGKGDDDIQRVDSISAGDTVIFKHTITNTGNGDDILNLAVANTGTDVFPTGTVFTFWNEAGTVQLTDSDSDGIPDTGSLGQDESLVIVVKADLPSGASGTGVTPGNGYNATLTATSSASPTVSDPTTLTLAEIKAPAVDLAASTDGTTTATPAGGQAITGFNDGGTTNAHVVGPVMLRDAIVGGTVSFPLSVANESGSADSFLLSAASVPTGWAVVFKDKNGVTVTSTPFLAPGTTFEYDAFVTVSSDATEALGNAPAGVDGYDTDGAGKLDGSDGDTDYELEFIVTSSVDSGRTDTLKTTVDVADIKAISITPDGQNQIQPGGTVDYPHTLKNDGNVNEAVELASENSGNNDGWSSSTLIDTDGDGVGDTELTTLKNPDGTFIPVTVYNANGTSAQVTPTDTDNDGNVEFPLAPGQYVKITNKVFAPANAPQGAVNTTTFTATDPVSANDPVGILRNTAEDNSTVILGQVRLTKTVALDTDCDGEPDAGSTFKEIQTDKVEPGQCATWNIVARNEGDATVKKVVVTDLVPAFTTLLAGSLTIDGTTVTEASDTDNANLNTTTNVITYYLGAGATSSTGGSLLSGESSTVRFTIQVDE